VTAQREDSTRPFRNYDAKQLLEAGRKAYRQQDRPVLLAAIYELDEYRNTREADRVSDELHELLNRLAPASGQRRGGIGYCQECSRTFEQADGFYCEGCWATRWARIERDAREIRGSAAQGVYVGRSAYPERRLLEHLMKDKRDRLSILHWASSLEEAEAFEIKIHKIVEDISDQTQPRAGGRFARCHHAIYISWTARSGFPADQLVHHTLVTELMTARQWPAPPSRFETAHLWCPMTSDDAENILADLAEREQDYLDNSRPGRR